MRTHGYLAFIVGICLTVWTCVMVSDAQDAQLRSNFERDSDKVASDTSVRLQTYFDMLLSIKGMFAVDENVTRADFARFVKELNLTQRYPGFQAIQFVRYVPAADLGRFEQRVRAEIAADPQRFPAVPPFAIHPKIGGEDHFNIDFNEPMARNENAFGLDLAALPPHRHAVEEGRDIGEVIATERITLVQDKLGQPGFVARAPVYRQGMPLDTVAQRRAAFQGKVAIVFRVNNLMREVIDPALLKQMAFRIHDAGETRAGAARAPDAGKIMFYNTASALAVPGLVNRRRINVAQRQWVMQFSALEGSRYSRDRRGVAMIAVGGIIISALIAALLMAFRRSSRLAEQLRISLDEQRAFQDSASVGIALFVGGQVMRCNRGMEELLGYGPGELLEKPIQVLDGGSAGVFAIEPQLRRWQGELELVRKDGSALWCLINGKALDAADLSKGGVWVVQDISDRKRTEAALVDAKDGLEHSLAELEQQKAHAESAHSDLSAVLATLKQAQNNLITAEKMASLGALVAGIAHELNTPIGNSLLTASALADMVAAFERKYAEGGIKRSLLENHLADSKLACDIMTSSLRRAADLITSFKQVAVDQTSDQRRPFDLCDVVRDTLATYAAQLRRVNCETRFDAPPSLVMDSYPGSVGQVLSNLINNALLHAFEGRIAGTISITVRPLDAGHISLVFVDDGVGMPARILHQVFDPFFTTKMGQGGSGLGMNIVYNIVTGMLGGTIEIESAAGKGTRVSIAVPSTAPNRDNESMDLTMLIA